MFWLLLAAVSCEALGEGDEGTGILRVSFADGQEEMTRTSAEIPDADDFTITVADSKGRSVYSGLYSACPEDKTLGNANLEKIIFFSSTV